MRKDDNDKKIVDELLKNNVIPFEQAFKKKTGVNQNIKGNDNQQTYIPEPSTSARDVSQTIVGNGNYQVSGNLTINHSKPTKEKDPPIIGSIGANPALVTRIESLINDIKTAQFEYHGKRYNWKVLNGQLGKAFGFSANCWKKIFGLPEERAVDVIEWLQLKYDNTIQGRKEKASARSGYRHTKQKCFEIETELAQDLGWSDEKLKKERFEFTRKTSRSYINVKLYNQWIDILRSFQDELS